MLTRLSPWTPGLWKRPGASRLVLWAALAAWAPAGGLRAETIGGALGKAYLSNPDVGQQRAAVRAADEEIPKASAGYRPKISAGADGRLLEGRNKDIPVVAPDVLDAARTVGYAAGSTTGLPKPRGFSLKASESLWDSGRTADSVREAESRVMAAREQLRNTEQNVLMDGVVAYTDVLRDTAILNLHRAHVHLLEEQLRETRDRFAAGEVTQTAIAEVEARLAGARAGALIAQSTLQGSIAAYRKVIGEEPDRLEPVKPLSKPLPSTLDRAIAISQTEHPAIVASLFGVDAAALDVNVVESKLYPSLVMEGLVDKRYNVAEEVTPTLAFAASATVRISVPIYDGGGAFAATRQAKEQLDQRELQTDLQREKVRAVVVSAWGRNENAAGLIQAATAQEAAAERVLAGTREEARLGQRTTQDELNAEQLLLRARIQLVTAERDQIVASYAMLSAVGRLSAGSLGLAVTPYDPAVHFDQVKDRWIGLRTPDGR